MANITFTQGSGVNDSIYGKSQAPIRAFLESRGESFQQQSVVKEIFNMMTSNNFGEKFTSMTAMEGFQPTGENGALPNDGFQEGYSKFLEHMTWKDSFRVSREMVEDSKLLELRGRPQAFITGYDRTREQFGAAVLGGAIKGLTSVSFRGKSFDISCADTLALFSTAHTSAKPDNGTTQTNFYADAFSADALGAAECAMQKFMGDTDEILDVSPTHIVIPNDFTTKKAVFAAIGADKDPATANNGFNYVYGRWHVIVWAYLNNFITANTTPWLLYDKAYNEAYNSAVWLDRTKLDVHSYVDENTHANVWSGYSRFTAGFNDWRGFLLGGISGGSTLIS